MRQLTPFSRYIPSACRVFFSALFCGLLSFLLVLPASAQIEIGEQAQTLHKVAGRPLAPDFELPDLEGETKRLSDYRGKVVVVNFWATWCPPCRKEIPSMGRAWKLLESRNVMMLAVHVGGTADKVWQFLTDYEVDFPVLLDRKNRSTRGWPLVGLPTSFVVDPKGRLALRAIGGRDWDHPTLIRQILALKS